MNAWECLQMGLQTLQTYLWMMRLPYQRCHCLAIFLRMMRIFDDEAAIGISTEWIWRWAHCFLEFNSGKTFARNGKRRTLQTPCECLMNVMLPNALPTLPMACDRPVLIIRGFGLRLWWNERPDQITISHNPIYTCTSRKALTFSDGCNVY